MNRSGRSCLNRFVAVHRSSFQTWWGAAEIIGNKEGLVIPLADEKLWLDTIRTIRQEAFHIAPGVAERKGLLVSQHMERMLDVI